MSGYEETFCVLQPCFVYRIPPRSSTQGYKAADWNLETPVWQGRISVKAKDEKCFIQLEDVNTGQIFAVCHVDPLKQAETVEPVLDSSRYYVLRIEDQQTKRHAFIGMGFNERDQSFEFKAAMQDYQRRIENEKRLREAPRQQLPSLNLTLKEGETIKVDIKTGGSGSNFDNYDDGDDDDDDGDMFLPPPPSGNKKISSMSTKSRNSPQRKAPAQQKPPQVAQGRGGSDPYGLLGSTDSPPQNSPSIPRQTNLVGVGMQPMQAQQNFNAKSSLSGMQQQFSPHRPQQQQQQQQSGRVPLNQMQPGQRPAQTKQTSSDPFANLVNF